jgi:hypothetical protein
MFALAIWSKKYNQKDYYENDDGLYQTTIRNKGGSFNRIKTNIKDYL